MKNGQQLWSGSGLPAGYTLLEYIESNGNQYIDTGFKPNQDTKVVADIKLSEVPLTYPVPFGSSKYWLYVNSTTSLSANWYTLVGGIERGTSLTGEGRQTIELTKSSLTSNGASSSISYANFQDTTNLYLFCRNDGTTQFLTKLKLYSCQIYDNGELVRDYIPCMNPEGICGLFDKVNKQFYRSSTLTDFTYL